MKMQAKFSVCMDCYLIVAYEDITQLIKAGVDKETVSHIKHSLSDINAHIPGYVIPLYEGYKEFSTTPCECCGSKLYGERHMIGIIN